MYILPYLLKKLFFLKSSLWKNHWNDWSQLFQLAASLTWLNSTVPSCARGRIVVPTGTCPQLVSPFERPISLFVPISLDVFFPFPFPFLFLFSFLSWSVSFAFSPISPSLSSLASLTYFLFSMEIVLSSLSVAKKRKQKGSKGSRREVKKAEGRKLGEKGEREFKEERREIKQEEGKK